MKVFILLSALVLTSCASMTEEVAGYSDKEAELKLVAVKGQGVNEAKGILGNPAAEGLCKQCGDPKGVYQLVYLRKPLPRYSFALSMSNKSALDCFITEFRYDESKKAYISSGNIMAQTGCASQYGTIASVRKFNE